MNDSTTSSINNSIFSYGFSCMSPQSFPWPIAELLFSLHFSLCMVFSFLHLHCNFSFPPRLYYLTMLFPTLSSPSQNIPATIKRVPSTHFHESCGNLVSLKETILPAQMPNQFERPTESLQDHTSLG